MDKQDLKIFVMAFGPVAVLVVVFAVGIALGWH